MKHHPNPDAAESWSLCRKAFVHRAAHVPEIGLIPPLIDRLVDQGYSSSLFVSSSLDNLLISDVADWRKQSERIYVIPKQTTVELRYYSHGELVEHNEFGSDRLYEEMDRILPKLLQHENQP